MEKTCFKCKETKPLDDFYKHPMMRDGHLNKCKECNKVDSSMRDPEKVKAYDRLRAKDPARKTKFKEAEKRRRLANPQKYSARQKLIRAVRAGILDRPNICQRCFSFGKTVAHHEDYEKPLEVSWLCEPCHKKRHVEINQANK